MLQHCFKQRFVLLSLLFLSLSLSATLSFAQSSVDYDPGQGFDILVDDDTSVISCQFNQPSRSSSCPSDKGDCTVVLTNLGGTLYIRPCIDIDECRYTCGIMGGDGLIIYAADGSMNIEREDYDDDGTWINNGSGSEGGDKGGLLSRVKEFVKGIFGR